MNTFSALQRSADFAMNSCTLGIDMAQSLLKSDLLNLGRNASMYGFNSFSSLLYVDL